jgi:hypothetical protein
VIEIDSIETIVQLAVLTITQKRRKTNASKNMVKDLGEGGFEHGRVGSENE